MNQTFVLLLVSALTVCAQDNQSAVQSNLDRMISNAHKADTDKSGAATAPRTSGETVAPATQTPPRRSFDSWASDLRLGSFAGNIAAGVKLATVGYRNTGSRLAAIEERSIKIEDDLFHDSVIMRRDRKIGSDWLAIVA